MKKQPYKFVNDMPFSEDSIEQSRERSNRAKRLVRFIIDWDKVYKRKVFIVSKSEVVFFIDTENILMVFISYPENDVLETLEVCSTETKAVGLLESFNIELARDWYYLLKKQL